MAISTIPTEPIGSIPRPPELIETIISFQQGKLPSEALEKAYDAALRDTIYR